MRIDPNISKTLEDEKNEKNRIINGKDRENIKAGGMTREEKTHTKVKFFYSHRQEKVSTYEIAELQSTMIDSNTRDMEMLSSYLQI